ncbi:hypothetical protein [Metamycoplasma auris]|uniref:Uncharacterized protein n=1 Tax=Metamycoplasma auris TaxID=51363 RepID=A0A2W7FXN3_9BACT|nr:hypothetical protein [Metamycoplasma auris]PZV98746.1 hypothetical protein BCF89_11115 [Metamycoplasma auris]
MNSKYLEKISKDKFNDFVSEFQSELTLFISGLKEALKDLSSDLSLEDINNLFSYNKDLSNLLKEQFEVLKNISGLR